MLSVTVCVEGGQKLRRLLAAIAITLLGLAALTTLVLHRRRQALT